MNVQRMLTLFLLCLLAWCTLAVAPTFAQTITHIPLYTFTGDSADDEFGFRLSGAGDVNGDGFADVIVGAPNDDNNGSCSGSARVFSGADGSILYTFNGDSVFDNFGTSVSGAGDVNGDGLADVIVGAPFDDNNGTDSGSARVFSGVDGSVLFTFDGGSTGDRFGWSVSGAGDVNGDGIDDLIVGATGADPGGVQSAGESYVVFGRDTGFSASFELSTLNGTNGFVINGIDVIDQSGGSVSGAGDVNGDGIDDLIIGARLGASDGIRSGESYVVFGQDASSGGFAASIDLDTLDGTTGFAINGVNPYDSSGTSVSGAGDVNGDGVDDLIIGANAADQGGNPSVGESYVVFGNSGGFAASIDLSTLDGSNGFVLMGIDAVDLSGGSVSGAGDVNGDGIDDLIIGATGGDPGGNFEAGESYVVFGRAAVPEFVLGDANQDGEVDFSDIPAFIGVLQAGSFLEEADVNRDGVVDFDDIGPFTDELRSQ